MGRPSRKGELLDAGVAAFHRQGYSAASVESITEAAGVPKGALFNHFGSKEGFAIESLKRYYERWHERVGPIVRNPDFDSLKKLRMLISAITDGAQQSSFSLGCLVGNFAAELSSSHDEVRLTISEIFRDWCIPFETIILEGQKAGEINAALPPHQAARFIVNALQGTLLRCKVDRQPTALNDFDDLVFGLILSSAR